MTDLEIKHIFFDLGGVLVDLDRERCQQAFRALGMPRVAELIDPCYPAEMIGRLEKGEISFHEACERMRELDGRPDIADEQIAGAYGAFLTDVPVAKLRFVDALRRRGMKTYVLSNNNPVSMEVIRRMFRADGRPMASYFDRIYLSYELGELKPSPAIFRRVLADSGADPAQSLFIDDGRKNVEAARELGFQVYMPAPNEDFTPLFDLLAAPCR